MSNTSCSRNAARSSGERRSSVSNRAIERSSASGAVGSATTGSGSHMPTYSSRRTLADFMRSTEPRDDASEERPRMLDRRSIGLAPAQEGVLHDVLGVGDRAEHAVREPHE